MGEVRKQHDTK